MALPLGSLEEFWTRAWLLFLLLSLGVQGDCPAPPNPPHARLRSGELQISYPTGTVLRYVCIPGYQFIVGSKPSLECLENTKWTETPTFCERKRCPVPNIENGDIRTTGDLQLGETVTFVCNTGFRMLGPNTARCTLYENSKVDWNRQPPECERIPCPRPPRIANGRHDGDEGFDHYDYGTVVTYTCEKDFSLIGTASLFCTSDDGLNGNWDRPAPECKVVVCQRPKIDNGRLTSPFQATYKYDHTLQFQCYAGHTLVGSEFVKCGADNQWHPALPSCVKGIVTTTTTSTRTVPVPPGGDVIPGIVTTSTTSSTGTVPVPPGGHEVPGTPVDPAILPTTETTEETVTGSTQRPGGTVPKNEQESNAMAIGIGVVVGLIVLAGIIFVFMKYKALHQTGKNDIRPGHPDSYREVSRHDTAMEMK